MTNLAIQIILVFAITEDISCLEKAKKFIEDAGYSFPVYYDTDLDAAYTYGVNSIPATYFIDAEGHAVVRRQGIIDADTLQYGIDMLTE